MIGGQFFSGGFLRFVVVVDVDGMFCFDLILRNVIFEHQTRTRLFSVEQVEHNSSRISLEIRASHSHWGWFCGKSLNVLLTISYIYR